MRKLKKGLVVATALMLVFTGSVPSIAQVKKWEVYHNQGAPADIGRYRTEKSMKKGKNIAKVKMTDCDNIKKSVISVYRKGHDDQKKYLDSKNKSVNMYINKNKNETIVIEMSTTDCESVSAKGKIVTIKGK